MPHACGIGNSTAGRHEASSVKALASIQILKSRDVRNSYSCTIASRLRSSAERVWEHASTFAGVKRELRPLARRTFPPALGRLTQLVISVAPEKPVNAD